MNVPEIPDKEYIEFLKEKLKQMSKEAKKKKRSRKKMSK
mgnify:CR=1 FL=1